MGWIGRYQVSIGEHSAGWIEVKVNIGITVGQYSDGKAWWSIKIVYVVLRTRIMLQQ